MNAFNVRMVLIAFLPNSQSVDVPEGLFWETTQRVLFVVEMSTVSNQPEVHVQNAISLVAHLLVRQKIDSPVNAYQDSIMIWIPITTSLSFKTLCVDHAMKDFSNQKLEPLNVHVVQKERFLPVKGQHSVLSVQTVQ